MVAATDPLRLHPVPRLGAETLAAVIEEARRRARRRHRAYAAVGLLVALGLLAYAGIAHGSDTRTVAGVVTPAGGDHDVVLGHRVGSYTYDTHPRFRDAVAVFGAPAQAQQTDPDVCELVWPSQGTALSFRAPSSAPCTSAALAEAAWTGASILSPAWTVDRGLRVGDSWSRVQQLYPAVASFVPPADGEPFYLAQRAVPLRGTRYIHFAELDVVVLHGRVSRIDVFYD
jgi:hypothetical protein